MITLKFPLRGYWWQPFVSSWFPTIKGSPDKSGCWWYPYVWPWWSYQRVIQVWLWTQRTHLRTLGIAGLWDWLAWFWWLLHDVSWQCEGSYWLLLMLKQLQNWLGTVFDSKNWTGQVSYVLQHIVGIQSDHAGGVARVLTPWAFSSALRSEVRVIELILRMYFDCESSMLLSGCCWSSIPVKVKFLDFLAPKGYLASNLLICWWKYWSPPCMPSSTWIPRTPDNCWLLGFRNKNTQGSKGDGMKPRWMSSSCNVRNQR